MSIVTATLAADAPGALAAALDVIRAGGLVVFPTDTVYGVGCDLWNPAAIARLYEAKARPRTLAIPVLVASPADVSAVAADLPPGFSRAVTHFWPGALTLIVPRQSTVPDLLCAGRESIAVRMPDHPVALDLLRRVGGALAVTSANRSGEVATATAEDALEDLAGRVELVLDGGRCPGGTASAIVDLTSEPPRLLRAGALSMAALRAAWPQLAT
jgi:L-threonylcarbamoyladenylate synthase